jgi:NAD(P)H-hydrate repair Nnr-like enzyme with NAD(P)H-hydrate dehydratase domain
MNPHKLTRLRLDALPLPHPSEEGDKETRGTVLVIGGSDAVPVR